MDIRSFFKSAGRPAEGPKGTISEAKKVQAPAPTPKRKENPVSVPPEKKRVKVSSPKPSPAAQEAKPVLVESVVLINQPSRASGDAKGVENEVKTVQSEERVRKKKKENVAPTRATNDVETFVFTGILTRPGSHDVLPREEAVEMVVELGGRCTSAVSGKTTYLVTGETLEDGRPYTEGRKYKKAMTLDSCTIMKADEFFEYIEDRRKQKKPLAETAPATLGTSEQAVSPVPKRNSEMTASVPKTTPQNPSAKVVSDQSALWVDKYQPRCIQDLVGNGKVLNEFGRWLQSWHAIHVTEEKPKPRSKQNPGAKAVLLSGPPGIGKSTMARLVAKVCGYTIFELNASDKRSKKLLHEALRDALQSSMIQVHKDGSTGLQRRCVVMDEVDGMSSGDRGGTQELIALLQSSKVPVIAICNDRQCQKVKSLANHCYDLRLQRPTSAQLSRRMMQIAAKEGVVVEEAATYAIAETTGGDVRQAINALQMQLALGEKSAEEMSIENTKKRVQLIAKDSVLRLTPFDACRSILADSKTRPLADRMDAFFVDYLLTPLLVAQHYVASINGNRRPDFGDKTAALARASEALSDAELVTSMIVGDNQNWSLLPTSALLHCRVGSFCGGGIGFPAFPEWLGKNSTRTKRKRIANEMGARLAHQSKQCRRGGLVMDVAEVLRKRLLKPMMPGGQGAPVVVDDLDTLGLNRDDLFETLKDLQWSSVAKEHDLYEQLSKKTKSAFTRMYNKKHKVSKPKKP